MKVEYFERRSSGERLEQVSRPRAGAWVHIYGMSLDAREVAQEFSLDANIVRDIADARELPRAEFKDGTEYIFIRLPVGAADAAETAPLLVALAAMRFMTISVHADFSPLSTDVFLTTSTDRPSSLLPAVIASGLVEYERRIRELADKITTARKRLSRYEVENADFVEFVAIEDSLNEYRSSLEGIANVVMQLQENRRKLFRVRDLEQLGDISQHIRQLLVAIHSNTQTITSIQNAYSTIANNVLNQRMKLLTTITILLAIPNVFYGMYGMNLALPFQHEPWAYFGIIGMSMLLILLVYLLAKRFRLF